LMSGRHRLQTVNITKKVKYIEIYPSDAAVGAR
jgi:hypothetical protein